MPSTVRSRRIAALSFTLVATVWSAACGRAPADAAPVQAAVISTGELGVADRSNEFVSLSASGRYVAAAWVAADAARAMDVYVAISEDSGATFGPAVRVNHLPGDARANGEQPPRVAVVAQADGAPHVVVFWLARRPSGSVLLTARSIDGGRRFSDAALVAGTDTVGNRGWHTMDVGPDGQPRLAWLDHRRMAAPAGGGTTHHHHTSTSGATASAATDPADTVAMAQRSDLFFAAGPDDRAPRALTPGVCYCCKTAMVHGPDGAIHVAWRHVYPGNMRDIAFTTSRDGGRTFGTPVRVSEDHWSIAGCPDDGPAMTVDAAGRVHVVWPTAVTAADGTVTKTLFHAMTTDGRSFTPRARIPHHDAAHHPQVAATGDGTVVVAWDGHIGDAAHVFRARGAIDQRGVMRFTAIDEPPMPGRYPAVIAAGGRTTTAWMTGGTPASMLELMVEPIR